MIVVRLRCPVRIAAIALERKLTHAKPDHPAFAVHNGHTNAERSEVNSCYDGHGRDCECALSAIRRAEARPSPGNASLLRAPGRPHGKTCPPRDARIRCGRCRASVSAIHNIYTHAVDGSHRRAIEALERNCLSFWTTVDYKRRQGRQAYRQQVTV